MDIPKILIRTVLYLSLIIGLSACKNSTSEPKETAYQKRNQTLALETEPASFRKYALVSSGDIMIHGMPNGLGWMSPWLTKIDWTAGCIAVSNTAIQEIALAITVGAKITIRP